MPRKDRKRKLWLKVLVVSAPEQWPLPRKTAPMDVLYRLLDSITDGTYLLPVGWEILISWKNGKDAPWKVGPWTEEMRRSAASSRGWDAAVTHYLTALIARLEGRMGQG